MPVAVYICFKNFVFIKACLFGLNNKIIKFVQGRKVSSMTQSENPDDDLISESETKFAKQHKKTARKSVAQFFGVDDEDKDALKWEKRRLRMASSIGSGLKDEYLEDDMGSLMNVPILGAARDTRKKSVVAMTLDGLKQVNPQVKQQMERKKSLKPIGQNFRKVSVSVKPQLQQVDSMQEKGSDFAEERPDFNITNDAFFDESPKIRYPSQQAPGVTKLLPDLKMDIGFRQIKNKILEAEASREKRQIGMGAMGAFTRRRLKSTVMASKEIKQQLDDLEDYRPIFTYWVTTVQIIIFFVSVPMPNLAIQTESYVEKNNMWLGPRQPTLSTWYKWSLMKGHDVNSDSTGSVCGQDPRFCNLPSSTPPFTWTANITGWPICLETVKPNQSLASPKDRHMNCEILGRPCCFGIQGQCVITTKDHCDLMRGFFHDEATLCSQIDCFEEICGMIPFAFPYYPDQFYRLWTSLFLHGGFLHLVVSIFFQMWIVRDLEKLMGPIRISIIYIGSGVAGNLASCIFIPYSVEVGPTGSQFGIGACLLVEVIQSFQMYKHPTLALMRLTIPFVFFFILGLLPWFDNWAHIFGSFFGFLLAFALMPYVSFGMFDKHRKMVGIVVCLSSATLLFAILVVIFYFAPLTECHWCIYLNCIPFTDDFCENMGVTIKKNATYSMFQ
ncbi:Inactive rhomboid protein 1 [Bulinus truncatus]|nr:Inactive rhomboid protein 1 [Bulinus truncatus]